MSEIAEIVATLREQGYDLTSEPELPYRHVQVRVRPQDLVSVAQRLARRYPGAAVEAEYNPRNADAVVGVFPDG